MDKLQKQHLKNFGKVKRFKITEDIKAKAKKAIEQQSAEDKAKFLEALAPIKLTNKHKLISADQVELPSQFAKRVLTE